MVAFATVEDLATFIQRDLDAADTATAQMLLDLASAAIRSYTGQTISHVVDDSITVDPPSRTIFLPQLPVTGVTSITVAGTLVPADAYYWYGDTGMINPASPGRWGRVPQSVEVVYSHGFAASAPETGVAQAACLDLAKKVLGAKGIDMKSESIGNYSVTYSAVAMALHASDAEGIRRSLDGFRLIAIA